MPRWSGFFGTPAPQDPQLGPLPAGTQGSSMTPETDYWNQPSVGGMPLHRFATMTGLLANAISPNSMGGRMGRAAAGMAGQYGNVALHSEQATRQQMMMAAAKAEQERQRQQELEMFLGRGRQPQAGGFGVRERQPEAPGAQPSLLGVPPVTTNLEGFGESSPAMPRRSTADIATLSRLTDPDAFKAITRQWEWGGELPNTEESYLTGRNMALANNPAVGGLVPNRMTNVTIDKGVPTIKFGQPSSPGEVEAQAITEQGGGPGARLQALRSQSETPAFPEKPTSAELRKQAEEEQGISQLERLKTFYSPDLVGPVSGRLLQQRVKYGRDMIGTPLSKADANFMALTKTIGNSVIHAISGAAVSAQEAERLMGQIPSELDPSTAWEAKYRQSLINIQELNGRMKQKTQGGGNSPSGGPRAISPQEEADAYLRGR